MRLPTPRPTEQSDLTTHQATRGGYQAVAAFTREKWSDRVASDYVPGINHD